MYFEKNCIELMVEIAELANETRCFKYWSIKIADKEEVLEEYADCITMILSFFTHFNLKLDNIPNHYETDDIILLFNELFKESSCMLDSSSENLVKTIFSNIVYLGKLLGFTDDELYEACYKKMNKIRERLSSDY